MEEERQRDLRVPVVSCLFFTCSLTGGIILILWLLDMNGSQPWFPILAMVLISIPWIFWLLAYIYTFLKVCFRRQPQGASRDLRGSSTRSSHARPPSTTATNNVDPASPQQYDSPTGKQRHVQFGQVVVMDSDSSSRGCQNEHQVHAGEEASVSSTPESERPLTLSVSS